MKPAAVHRAAELISKCKALVICAGAGMGVDSGLPDFRGRDGFWKAYPVFHKSGQSFTDVAKPSWFQTDPAQAWGFYGQRLNLYRKTQPHSGFDILLKWARSAPAGYGVYTSNVDGHFQRAGFQENSVVETHGSIHVLQCSMNCGMSLFPVGDADVKVDSTTLRAERPFPVCPQCAQVARPNILMFEDSNWIGARSSAQGKRVHAWLKAVPSSDIVVIECGAGKAIPTIRFITQQVILSKKAKVIRVNPREEELLFDDDGIAIQGGAKESLFLIDDCLRA